MTSFQETRRIAGNVQAAGGVLARDNTVLNTTSQNYATERQMVPAVIKMHSVITAGLKWKYEWEEVRFTASTASVATKTNGLKYPTNRYAYNWNELNNTAAFWAPLGNPANVPAGFTLQPIAINTPVLLFAVRDTTGLLYWVFDKVNAIDGECEAAP